MQFTKDYQR